MRSRILCLTFGAVLLVGGTNARAQDVEPRVLAPAPAGTNFAGIGLAHSSGAVLLDKTLPVDDLDGSTYSLIASYSRYLSLFGLTSRLSAALPLATGEWDALFGEDRIETNFRRTGLGDSPISVLIFLVGARSMTPAEFRNYRRRTLVGFNLRVMVPVGQYDPENLVNLGSNRWQIVPALALSQRIGKWTAEGYAGAWFFTDNTSFLGDNVLSQEPLVSFQLILSYNFKPGFWLALGARRTLAGETAVNGVSGDTPTQNSRLALTVGFPVSRRYTVRLLGSTGLRATSGTDFDTLMMQLVYGW